MSASAIKEKNQHMAADLVRRGIYHGRRTTVGLSAFPVDEPGSAAYRRLQHKNHARNAGK